MSAKKLNSKAELTQDKESSDIPPQPVAKTICLVQLTRIGDVIQVIQTAVRLKETREEIRLAFIGRREFSKPLEFLLKQVFDEIFYLDLSEHINNGKGELAGTVSSLTEFVKEVSALNISALINYSYSRSSAYLCSLITAQHKLGLYYDQNSNIMIHDNWSQFVYSNVLGTSLNPFSLVDLYFRTLGVEPYKEQVPTVREVKNKKIVIHPFASHARKKWKESKWIEIIYKVLKEHPTAEVNIVGSKEEEGLTTQITTAAILAPFSNRLFSHVGKKNIEGVYQLLGESDLFIGHDSMVGHLASLQGIQTLTISLGTVRPVETTPYIAGGYVITPRTKCFPCAPSDECQLYQCHSDITHQYAYSVIDSLLNKEEITHELVANKNVHLHMNSAHLYRTEFSNEGFFNLAPVLNQGMDTDDVLRRVYRVLWCFILSEAQEKTDYPEINQTIHADLLNTLKGLQTLYELAEFGKKYSRYILEEISGKTPDIAKIKEFSAKIDEVDSLKEVVKKSYPSSAPIINYFRLKKGNLSGNNLVEITESSFLTYNECAQCTGAAYELIEGTIAEYKLKNNIKINQKDQSV